MTCFLIQQNFFSADNDKPGLSASSNNPVEGGTNVRLTCAEATSTSDTATSYEWYKDGSNTPVNGETSLTYNIGNLRSAEGSYTCKVVAQNSPTSEASEAQTITFYCEYSLN